MALQDPSLFALLYLLSLGFLMIHIGHRSVGAALPVFFLFWTEEEKNSFSVFLEGFFSFETRVNDGRQ